MENSVTFDPCLDYGATFRFPVTWSYLAAAATTPRAVPAPVNPPAAQGIPKSARPVTVQPSAAKPVEAVAATMELATTTPIEIQKPTESRTSGPDAKWEMVIPKMARPVTQTPSRATPRTAPATATPAETTTDISFYTGSEASFVPRRWKVASLCAAAAVIAGVIAWVRPGATGSASDSAPAAAGTWSRRTAYVVGGREPREILIYSGSEDVKNYRIEFSWVPDTRGVGWLFRGTDSANYYAANLRLVQAGATPSLAAEHFAVVKGVEGTHSRRVLTLGRTKGAVMVRMDANGPAFTLYLQGSPADYWTDERFETGSLGFYAERGERPVLEALRFTFFRKSGLETVVTSLQ